MLRAKTKISELFSTFRIVTVVAWFKKKSNLQTSQLIDESNIYDHVDQLTPLLATPWQFELLGPKDRKFVAPSVRAGKAVAVI